MGNLDSSTIPDFDQFTRRVIQDALADATRQWWLRRAEDFERAKPIPGEYQGAATLDQLRARWQWCHDTAQACRNKAAVVPLTSEQFRAEVDAFLDEEAAA